MTLQEIEQKWPLLDEHTIDQKGRQILGRITDYKNAAAAMRGKARLFENRCDLETERLRGLRR